MKRIILIWCLVFSTLTVNAKCNCFCYDEPTIDDIVVPPSDLQEVELYFKCHICGESDTVSCYVSPSTGKFYQYRFVTSPDGQDNKYGFIVFNDYIKHDKKCNKDLKCEKHNAALSIPEKIILGWLIITVFILFFCVFLMILLDLDFSNKYESFKRWVKQKMMNRGY